MSPCCFMRGRCRHTTSAHATRRHGHGASYGVSPRHGAVDDILTVARNFGHILMIYVAARGGSFGRLRLRRSRRDDKMGRISSKARAKWASATRLRMLSRGPLIRRRRTQPFHAAMRLISRSHFSAIECACTPAASFHEHHRLKAHAGVDSPKNHSRCPSLPATTRRTK